MTAPLWLFIWVMFMAFAIRRLISYLHIFQQEEYDTRRFLRWIVCICACRQARNHGVEMGAEEERNGIAMLANRRQRSVRR